MNYILESIAQTIFYSWFVNFDPIKLKSDGESNVIDAQTLSLFPDCYDYIQERRIPKGWSIQKLDNLCKQITDGSHFSPQEMKNGSYKIATVKNMKKYDFDLNSSKKISKEDYDNLVKWNCRPDVGDILLSKDGTMGIVHKFYGHQDVVILSSIAIIKPKKKDYSNYLYWYLRGKEFQDNIYRFSSGSVLTRLVVKNIKEIPLLKPPDNVIEQFNKYVDSIFEKIILNEQESHILEEIRNNLLPKLISGELEIDNINNFEGNT
jgi:type I restriction enzyme S subunit